MLQCDGRPNKQIQLSPCFAVVMFHRPINTTFVSRAASGKATREEGQDVGGLTREMFSECSQRFSVTALT
jgi:hypothetical protein